MLKLIYLPFWLILFFWQIAQAQISGTVTDQATGKPVAFANIWVEDQNMGTTSEEDGTFTITNANAVGKMLVVSSLGYERARVSIMAEPMKVLLKPAVVALPEVMVKPSTKRQKLVLGQLTEKRPYTSYGNGGSPWIVAEFVPYLPRYAATPFIDEIAFTVSSMKKNAKFQIRLLEIKENGEPGNDLIPEPLIAFAPKGYGKVMKLNVSQFNLQIPEKGFYVAFEWFIIEENKHVYTYTRKGSKKKYEGISYEPNIVSHQVPEEERNAWVYMKGVWSNKGFKGHDGARHLNRAPQFQITLSD